MNLDRLSFSISYKVHYALMQKYEFQNLLWYLNFLALVFSGSGQLELWIILYLVIGKILNESGHVEDVTSLCEIVKLSFH